MPKLNVWEYVLTTVPDDFFKKPTHHYPCNCLIHGAGNWRMSLAVKESRKAVKSSSCNSGFNE